MNYLNFNRVAEIYDKTRYVAECVVNDFSNVINEFMDKNIQNSSFRVLSLGIGSGRIESTLSSRKIHLFGTDISNLMLEEFQKKTTKYSSFLTLADGCLLPFRPYFDLVIAIHVVHLISDYEQLITELEKITSNLVIGDIFTESHNHPLYQKYIAEINETGWKKESSGFSTEEFSNFLKKRGLQISKKEISYPATLSNFDIYDSLKNRYFSSLWTIPDNIHKETIQKINDFISIENFNLQGNFETQSYIRLYFIHLKK